MSGRACGAWRGLGDLAAGLVAGVAGVSGHGGGIVADLSEGPIRGPDLAEAVVEVLVLIEGATLDGLLDDVAAAVGDPGLPRDQLASVLHRLDDAGRVWMRNGFYRLSAAERLRRAEGVRHVG